MSRKVLKKKFYEEKEEDAEENVKCPPQVHSSNLNEEWASHKPTTSHKHHHRLHYTHEHQDEEAVAMEEGVPFEEKEEIIGANNTQNFVAKEGIGVECPDTSGGQRTLSPSRRPDVSPGAEALGTGVHHPTEGRHTRIQERVIPGAIREGGLDNEEEDEEDERTIQSHTEPPIPPTVSAELVDAEEEERRRQDNINQALQKGLEKKHELVQRQINQALQRERQQVVVAEVVSKRDRRWKFAGAFLLIVLIVIGVVLGITLRPNPDADSDPETLIPQDLIDLLSNASSDSGEALSTPSTPQHEALEWLANSTNLANYTGQEKIQRYALATLYYSTKGNNWTRSDFWVSGADVCGKWYEFNDTAISCTSAGAVSSLSLHNNNLMGTIPAEIGMLSDSLVGLYLGLNELGGTLTNEIAFLKKLTSLNLWSNILTGTIPTTLGSLILLEDVFLYENALEGPIPTELAQCENLKLLSFANNKLTGDFGPIINVLPRSLTALDLNINFLSGTVPTSIGTFTKLDWLGLWYNNLNGTIPTELGLLSNLEVLDLSSNRLTGTIPTSLGSLSLLKELLLYDNDLTGSLDAFCGIDYDVFAANTCAQDEINCTCCTHCCDPGAISCEAL